MARILILKTGLISREQLRKRLWMLGGHEVSEAMNVEEASYLINNEGDRFDIIIMADEYGPQDNLDNGAVFINELRLLEDQKRCAIIANAPPHKDDIWKPYRLDPNFYTIDMLKPLPDTLDWRFDEDAIIEQVRLLKH